MVVYNELQQAIKDIGLKPCLSIRRQRKTTNMSIHHPGEWSGLRGKFHAWFFGTWTRKLLEILFFGNYWTAFKREMFKRIRHGDETVLDIGAGSGNFSLPIARRLKNGIMYCLDSSPEMTDRLQSMARRHASHDRIRVLNLDAGATGLADNSIDWVVSGNCMHEMSDPARIWAEIHRVLKPNGAAFIVDFRDRHGYHDDAHGPYSIEQLRTLFEEARFKRINVEAQRHFVIGIGEK